jgi:hypothetical protein
LLTGGNLSGTFSFNRHLGGDEEMPNDADIGNFDNHNLTYTVHYMVAHITRKTSGKERGFHENYTLKFNLLVSQQSERFGNRIFFRHLAILKFPNIFVNDASDLNNAHEFCNTLERML